MPWAVRERDGQSTRTLGAKWDNGDGCTEGFITNILHDRDDEKFVGLARTSGARAPESNAGATFNPHKNFQSRIWKGLCMQRLHKLRISCVENVFLESSISCRAFSNAPFPSLGRSWSRDFMGHTSPEMAPKKQPKVIVWGPGIRHF